MAAGGLGMMGSLLGAIVPLMGMMMGGGGQQQAAPAPLPPPPPPPEPEPEPENAADLEAAKRRSLQRTKDRQQESLLALQDEDPTKVSKKKTLLSGGDY